jgi:hypothetical protein
MKFDVRAERRAAPKPARVPGPCKGLFAALGDRQMYPFAEGWS